MTVGTMNRAGTGSSLRDQSSAMDNTNQPQFMSSNDTNLVQRNSVQQLHQPQQASAGGRAFTQQNFYGQALPAQKSNSQSPARRQGGKTQNSKKGMNNDLSMHNEILGGSNS